MRVNIYLVCMAMITLIFGALVGDNDASAGISDDILEKVALVLPFENYSNSQYHAVKSALEPEGIAIRLVSTKIGEATVTPKRGGLQTDLTIDQLKMAEFDALIFIGSFAGIQSEYIDNPHAHKVVRDAVRNNKIIAAL